MCHDTSMGLVLVDLIDLFPFHLVISPDFRIAQSGRALSRLCPELRPGAPLAQHFRLLRPAQEWSPEVIQRANSLVMIENIDNRLTLKGELRRLPKQDMILFIGVPWISSLSELQQRGLLISDFPLYEPISDYLFLLQAKNDALAETERLAAAVAAQRQELSIKNRMLLAQIELSQGLVQAHSLEEAYQSFLGAVVKHLGWDLAALWLPDAAGQLACVATSSNGQTPRSAAAIAQGRSVVEQAHQAREMVCAASEPLTVPETLASEPPYRFVLAIPLPGMSEGAALLQVFRQDPSPVEPQAMATLLASCARVGLVIERQRVQAALADERARLQAVLAHTGALVYSARCDTLDITFVSDNIEQVLGYSKQQALGMSIHGLHHVHPQDRARLATVNERLSQGPLCIDYRIQRADGSYQWRSDYLRLVPGEAGQPAEIFGASLDLSARKETELALKDSEARLRAVLDNAAEGILAVDEHGLVQLCNSAAARLLRRELAQVQHQHVRSLGLLSQLWSDCPDPTSTQPALALGSHDLEGWDADETPYQLQVNISEVLSQDRRLYVGILRDRTAEQQAHRALQRAKAAAETANRAKSDFLAVVSHEIRTPLNVIIGMTELARSSRSPSEQQEFLTRVHTNADALLHLINSMLDLSKIEACLLDIESIPFDCAQLVGSVVDAVASRLTSRKVELICAVAPELPALLLGDPTRLRQILMNLLGNAAKFTRQGEVCLLVERVDGSAGATDASMRLRFTVSDTGIGIPKEVQSRIFERFFQADSSTSRRFGGSGLGLTISRSLVSLMGGTLGFESEPGRGSSFYFEIPFLIPAQQPAPPLADVGGRCVLIVEEHAFVRSAMSAVLLHRGFQVLSVENARQAREILQRAGGAIAVVLLDGDPSRTEARELAAQLVTQRQDGPALLLLTPIWATAPVLPAQRRRQAEYLIKPVANARLVEAVERACGMRRSTAELSPEGETPQLVSSRHHRVLVVEDNVDNQRLAWHALTKAGYHPELAENGAIAVERAAATDYDLIIMDIEMPELDGFQATASIRANEARGGRPRVPIVAVTAHAVPAFRQKCLDAGMDDYATKPMERQRLLALAEQWIDKRPVVLIADDSADSRTLLSRLLQQVGDYRVVQVRNGAEAVEAVQRMEVALVLLDVEMPVLDGLQATQAIRRLDGRSSLPIVAITGHDGSAERARIRTAGCTCTLTKPVQRPLLKETVLRFLPERLATPYTASKTGEYSAPKFADLPSPSMIPTSPPSPARGERPSCPGYQPELVPPEILDLVPAYLQQCRSDISRLRSLLSSNDYSRIATLAHNMKGTAPSYGFPVIGRLASRLERQAQANDQAAALRIVIDLENHLLELPALAHAG